MQSNEWLWVCANDPVLDSLVIDRHFDDVVRSQGTVLPHVVLRRCQHVRSVTIRNTLVDRKNKVVLAVLSNPSILSIEFDHCVMFEYDENFDWLAITQATRLVINSPVVLHWPDEGIHFPSMLSELRISKHDVSDREMRMLGPAIDESNLEIISFANCTFNSDFAHSMLQDIVRRAVTLDLTGVQSRSPRRLLSMLKRSLTTHGCRILSLGLPSHPLEDDIDIPGLERLTVTTRDIPYIRCPSLRELYIPNNDTRVDWKALAALAGRVELLWAVVSLQKAFPGDQQDHWSCMEAISTSPTLKQLYVTFEGDGGAVLAYNLLQHRTPLKTLAITNLPFLMLEPLALFIQCSTTLTTLTLSSFNLVHAKPLLVALCQHSTLTYIDLDIRGHYADVPDLLSGNTILQTLILRHGIMYGVQLLGNVINSLSANHHLKRLYFVGTFMGYLHEYPVTVFEPVAKHPTLEIFKFELNSGSYTDVHLSESERMVHAFDTIENRCLRYFGSLTQSYTHPAIVANQERWLNETLLPTPAFASCRDFFEVVLLCMRRTQLAVTTDALLLIFSFIKRSDLLFYVT